MDRIKTRVLVILPRQAVEHVTAETAKSLKPDVELWTRMAWHCRFVVLK
jgi:hypothetical protein